MTYELIAIFVTPALVSFFLTPWVIRFAHRIGALDTPDERKIHKTPIPRLGGIAIFGSLISTLYLMDLLLPREIIRTTMLPDKFLLLVLSLLVVTLLGVWDDLRSLSPKQKFLIQLIAGSIVYYAGFRITSVTHPFGDGQFNLGFASYPATILWLIGITNAINLIDGLDGLASGVSIIAAFTIFAISILNGDIGTAVIVLALAGAVFGFLRYNFNPAKIFLGDSGSLLLGFSLAVLSITSSTKGSTAIAIIVPILALGLPIMDTLLSMLRRFLHSVLGSERTASPSLLQRVSGMFLPDRRHIHHMLIARGLSHRNAVLLLYFVSCLFGVGAFAVTVTNTIEATYIMLGVAVAIIIGVRELNYREMALLRNGSLLPLYQRPFIHNVAFQGTLDLVFIVGAYVISYFMQTNNYASVHAGRSFLSSITLVGAIQIATLSLLGMYQTTIHHFGIGDLLRMIKAVITSVLLTGVVLELLPQTRPTVSLTMFIIDFYLLLTFVVGARISFHVLNYLSHRDSESGKRVLIYGADAIGVILLQQLLSDNAHVIIPIGFLDDAPSLEGKKLNGYPIFGSHWQLPKLLQKYPIDEIILTKAVMMSEVMDRLKRCAREHHIALSKLTIDVTQVPTDGAEVPAPREVLPAFSVSSTKSRELGGLATSGS